MKIRIIDDVAPEGNAMLQALYSRSAESVDVHVEKLRKTGSAKFMQSYYVGYNHKSIADCGSTTIFIEGVSLLAAKAIQDWPLYSGQETSTRYINMATQPIVDPLGTDASRAVLDRWMDFYRGNLARAAAAIAERHPRRDGEDAANYERAVKARAFDVMRGFLPAGITTQLSWHTNLRQASDHLTGLRHHPLEEVETIADWIAEACAERYPSSGFDAHLAGVSGVSGEGEEARRAWNRETWRRVSTYPRMSADKSLPPALGTTEFFRPSDPEQRTALRTRPRGCVLPHMFADLGTFKTRYLLDFGSFRDVQRHRNGVCRMPLLTTDLGFETWYATQLGDDFEREAMVLVANQARAIADLTDDPTVRQYYAALGFRVEVQATYALPALLYVLELRTSKTVHPTLRAVMTALARKFAASYGDIALHADLDPDDWDVRRGAQTITAR